MASGSPQSRIDQFFASKKRKPSSPGLKSGKIEKETKPTAEISPNTKGTLDNYLRASQVGEDATSPACISSRRNLALDIDNYSRNESERSMSVQVHPQSSMPFEKFQIKLSQETSEMENVSVEDLSDDHFLSVQGVKSAELKQFATDFLSLYCSGVQSHVSSEPKMNDHKRQGSPLLNGEDKTSTKRHCVSSQLQTEGENECSNQGNLEVIQSTLAMGVKENVLNSSKEVIVGNNPVELQATLRKCNRESKPMLNTTEFSTPGSSSVKARIHQTPQSMHGSSMFSPGEAFWNEAIQIADGLFAQTDNFSPRVSEEINNQRSQQNIRNSYNLGSKSTVEKAREMLVEGESSDWLVGFGESLESVGKQKKEAHKEVSPLPVKHLDFSFEEKNIGMQDTELPECGSVSHKGPSTSKIIMNDQKLETTEKVHQVQERTSILAVAKRKGDLSIEENHSITSTAPVDQIKNSTSIGSSVSTEAGTPSSSVILKDCLSLKNWLPSEICSIYKRKGISEMYPWQVDCLRVDGVLHTRNLVYCASTSAGKSFVAEILMLRHVISTGKMALLVLPYVSICVEKAEHLEVLLEPLGKHVRSYYGNQGGGTLPKDTSVAVCTIEKANSLINRLLEEGRLSEIGIIVIDELHMVGDQSRGYLLELLLTKLRYAAGEGISESSSEESSGTSSGKADPARGLQIVGMSATMPNVEAVADWLKAALYQTEFRPVPLEEYIKIGNAIYNKNLEIVRTIPRSADLGGKDPDHVVELCNEVVQEGHSVLIFCSSRKGCESTARHVSKFLKKFSFIIPDDSSVFGDITSAIDALRRCPAGLDPILEEILPSGVAYHHAGLTVEEREIIETCYRKGLVRVLTATSTLAAGVNLPARRVIFRQPKIGLHFLDGTRYKQMAGRAGRTGIDTKGESVLICKPEEVKRISGLLNQSCPPLQSCLSEDKNGMTHAILEVVAGGIVQTANDINRYVRCTLLNSTKPFEDVVKSAQDSLRWLCHKKFLDWNDDTKLYGTSPLGRASFGSSLSPEESLIVLDDLSRAREGFVLASDLHLVYLVTPINVDVEPNWELYYERFMELPPLEQSVGYRVGVAEPFLMRMAHGATICASNRTRGSLKGLHGRFENQIGISKNNVLSDEQTLRVCKRFYVALILSRLVQEAPVPEVCEAFNVARGMVQALQENAGRFASMVSAFCERLGWHDLEGLVAKFQNRVSFGVRAEIVELTTILYVKGSRARALYKAGLRTPLAIAEASIPEIVKALYESSSWAAQESSAQKRMQLGVAKKIKNGARKIVLDKAEEARIAAFSAFKSLGFSVPQFSRPFLLSASSSSAQGVATNVGVDSPRSFIGVEQIEHLLAKPMIQGNEDLVKVSSENEGKQTSISNIVASTPKVDSASAIQGKFNVENPAVPVELSVTHSEELSANVAHTKSVVTGTGTGTIICAGHHDQGVQEQTNQDLCLGSKDNFGKRGPINAASIPGGFDSFLELWESIQEFCFDIHYNKRSEFISTVPFEMHGIAVCWENSPVYYVNLPKDLLWSNNRRDDFNSNDLSPEHCLELIKDRWKRIGEIMEKRGVRKVTWNLKVQIQVLRSPVVSIQRFGFMNLGGKDTGVKLVENSYLPLPSVLIKDGIDMCIVAWILWPDEGRSSSPNLEKEVKKRLSSEAAAAANQCGRWKNQMRRAAHNGCCRRAAQIRALCSALWKLLISEELIEVLLNIETPLVNVLAEMELWGIGVDMEGCLWARNLLGKKLRCLEKDAYELAGMTFSLYTAADIANVLYGHLKLPIPEGRNKGKQHPSTDKHCLDLLRDEHPIIPIIREHRTLAKLLNCTLGSICSLSRLPSSTQKYTLHGRWLQTSTSTGRLSMEEPNLQCVEHMVEFELGKNKNEGDDSANHYKINARDFFVPTQDDWVLLAADYSQIELRLMAHFSKDSALIELLSKPQGDVFTLMAATWTGKQEDSIGSHERDQTKRLVYGILYGMGANTLAEQLNCSSDEAKEKIKSFKSSFPDVASWLREAVSACHQKGYVQTLKGRKRFLSKIKFGNSKEKSKAQRQAVNSICQGSAADIIKIAMIKICSMIVGEADGLDSSSTIATKFHMLKGHCRILLQVHDELVLEVEPSVIREAALLLQTSMESAASLLVPLPVKLKVGRTWGSLEPFSIGQDIGEVQIWNH